MAFLKNRLLVLREQEGGRNFAAPFVTGEVCKEQSVEIAAGCKVAFQYAPPVFRGQPDTGDGSNS